MERGKRLLDQIADGTIPLEVGVDLDRFIRLPHHGTISNAVYIDGFASRLKVGGYPLDAPRGMAELKKWFKRSGMTEAQLADMLGVGRVTVSRWFNGRNRPRQRDLIDRIYKLTGVVLTPRKQRRRRP